MKFKVKLKQVVKYNVDTIYKVGAVCHSISSTLNIYREPLLSIYCKDATNLSSLSMADSMVSIDVA